MERFRETGNTLIRWGEAGRRYFEELVLSKDLTTGAVKRSQAAGQGPAEAAPPPPADSAEDAPVAVVAATASVHSTTVAAEGGAAAAIPAVVRFVDGGIAVRPSFTSPCDWSDEQKMLQAPSA